MDSTLKTVVRALSVLDCFTIENGELSYIEIKNITGLPKSTVSRLIQTLEAEGYLTRNYDNMKLSLGRKMCILGMVANYTNALFRTTKPHIDKIHKKYDQNTNLYVLDNYERVCAIQMKRIAGSKTMIKEGYRYPIIDGSAGKAILAFLSDEEISKIIKDTNRKYKDYINEENLLMEIEKIRRDNYAIQDPKEPGHIQCVSAPIFEADNKIIGCFSVSGQLETYPKNLDDVINDVKESAKKISLAMGQESRRAKILE